jgi:uncharacterized protein YwqG
MDIHEIKNRLIKRATGFTVGSFKPTHSDKESWIGQVSFYKEEESIPEDAEGLLMQPLLQLSLEGLPFIPEGLENIRMLTIFISEDLPTQLADNGDGWLLRAYNASDKLVYKELDNPDSYIRPFPLKTTFIKEDYPVWDSGDIPAHLEEEILQLEKEGEIEDYYSVVDNHYGHKLGGYPTFYQSGIDFGEGFEFLLQIASDEKARLNIIDNGTIFLARNKQTGQWRLYVDYA